MGNVKSESSPTCNTSVTRPKVTLHIYECLRKNGEKMYILVDSNAYFQPPGPSRIISTSSAYEFDDALNSSRDIANILNVTLYEHLSLPKAQDITQSISMICSQ